MVAPFPFSVSLFTLFNSLRENLPLLRFQPGRKEVQPRVETAFETETLTQTREEGQVVVHCHFLAFPGALVRIWKSTFLISESGSRSALVHAENISFAPVWTELDGYGIFTFTLIFSPLPKDCTQFDLREEIEQSGAFFVSDIPRNESDIYHVWM